MEKINENEMESDNRRNCRLYCETEGRYITGWITSEEADEIESEHGHLVRRERR